MRESCRGEGNRSEHCHQDKVATEERVEENRWSHAGDGEEFSHRKAGD